PEVLRSGSGYSCAGDVWALGTVAYYLLTSSFPYNGGDPVGSFSLERFNRPLAAPSLSNSAVGADLDRLVADMLRIDPTERPATARDVAQRVRKLAAPVDEPGESRAVVASPESRQSVDVIVRYALRVSREPGRLTEAADLLEEAISRDPALRKHQLNRLTTWRRGVVM
ncbi:MAG: hypothetical protein LBV60_18585, partial [Streptomyces sp.]|nr:hypothetical protein [Streptomyces sp.]